MKNWRDTIGYELHTIMPLYMQGKAAVQARAGAWTLRNVTYDGTSFVPAKLDGEELAEPGEIADPIDGVRDKKQIFATLTAEQKARLETELEDGDIVVAYTGDEPRVLLRVSGTFSNSNDSWTSAYPYLVEHRAGYDVGYYSGREFTQLLRSAREKSPDAGSFYYMDIYAGEHRAGSVEGEMQEGVAEVLHVQLAKTRGSHVHNWSRPTYTWSEDNSSVTARATCKLDTSHTIERTVPAAYAVTRQPSATEAGEATYTAAFSEAPFVTQTKTVEVPAGSLPAGDDPADGNGNSSSGNANATPNPNVPSMPGTPSASYKARIEGAAVELSAKSYTYNGKQKRPRATVTLGGAVLAEGRDYTVSYRKNTSAGTATVVVTGTGAYEGSAEATFAIKRAANPLKVSKRRAGVPARLVAGRARMTRPLAVKGAKGALKVTKTGGSKRLSLHGEPGQVSVRKGTPAGTYRIKVRVKAAGNANYKPKTKTVKATVVVR